LREGIGIILGAVIGSSFLTNYLVTRAEDRIINEMHRLRRKDNEGGDYIP
jgi:hypothetical protein